MKIRALSLLIAFILVTTFGITQSLTYDSWGKGLNFTTADSSGSVRMSARIQNLVVIDHSLASGKTDVNAMTRRARLKFDGYALTPKLTYKIELGLSNRDISNSQEAALVFGAPRIIYDAVLKYQVAKGTSIWFGQTKLPGNRERVISSQKLQFVDRSQVNSRFNIDRDFGFQIHNEFSVETLWCDQYCRYQRERGETLRQLILADLIIPDELRFCLWVALRKVETIFHPI